MRSPLVALVTLAAFLLLIVPPRLALAADSDEVAAAKQHFEAGRGAYLGGDYARAINEFQAAQALRPSPILDYNIALSYEGLGDAGNAYAAYQRYLTGKPDAANRAEVEQHMAQLAKELRQPPASSGTQTGAQAQGQGQDGDGPYGQATPAPMKPPPAKKKSGSMWWLVFPIVGGVVLTGLIIWAATSSGSCEPPDCSGTYLKQPLSMTPGDPGAVGNPGVSLTLPGEVLRF